MTLAQMTHFAKAADHQRKMDRRDMLEACLAGARYDPKDVKKLFKELSS